VSEGMCVADDRSSCRCVIESVIKEYVVRSRGGSVSRKGEVALGMRVLIPIHLAISSQLTNPH
jgi:hypothetical protein